MFGSVSKKSRPGEVGKRGIGVSRRRFIANLGAVGMIALGEVPAFAKASLPPLVFIHGIKGSVLTDK